MSQPALFDAGADSGPQAPALKPRPARRPVRQLPDCLPEPWQAEGKVPRLHAATVARELAALVADFHAGKATWEELDRFVCGATWVLTNDELCRVAEFMADLLGGES